MTSNEARYPHYVYGENTKIIKLHYPSILYAAIYPISMLQSKCESKNAISRGINVLCKLGADFCFIFSGAGDGLPGVFLCNFRTLIAPGIRHGKMKKKEEKFCSVVDTDLITVSLCVKCVLVWFFRGTQICFKNNIVFLWFWPSYNRTLIGFTEKSIT